MIKVAELFAGVGGFRLGLEGRGRTSRSQFQVVWSNQWEPSTKAQHANQIYTKRWGAGEHCPDDISTVDTSDIPNHDLLVGGFPCQDYSVATTLKNSKGLIGKKGVLWWQIHRILVQKESKKPKYLLLENVDRLLKSPSTQRGRDFALILSSLNQLGYAVEWKVINAAEYGMPQRRRRVFIMGYHRSTTLYKKAKAQRDVLSWVTQESILGKSFASAKFPQGTTLEKTSMSSDLVELSEKFNEGGNLSPFQNSGFMMNGSFYSVKTTPSFRGKECHLSEILLPAKDVPVSFFIADKDLEKWKYLKGAKDEKRYNKAQGFHYSYNEGAMVFPDALDRPSRTIITGEGGPSPSRFKHVVKQNGMLRRLTPLELERLNMFPDDHTKLEGVTDGKRAFLMGNALVVGVVAKIGQELSKRV